MSGHQDTPIQRHFSFTTRENNWLSTLLLAAVFACYNQSCPQPWTDNATCSTCDCLQTNTQSTSDCPWASSTRQRVPAALFVQKNLWGQVCNSYRRQTSKSLNTDDYQTLCLKKLDIFVPFVWSCLICHIYYIMWELSAVWLGTVDIDSSCKCPCSLYGTNEHFYNYDFSKARLSIGITATILMKMDYKR